MATKYLSETELAEILAQSDSEEDFSPSEEDKLKKGEMMFWAIQMSTMLVI